MKRKFQFLTILSIFILVSPIIVLAVSSPPGIPLLVYGEVTIDGHAASVGTEILAEIDSVKVATINITNAGKYFVEVPDGKVNEGKMITFKVNGIVNSSQLKCVNINTTPSISFSLAVVTSASTPPPATTAPSGGGSYTPSTPSPLPSATPTGALTPAQQQVDANKDGKIDILDFNTLMINWDSAVANNVADFNKDGKVDIFDFNLLMINWSV